MRLVKGIQEIIRRGIVSLQAIINGISLGAVYAIIAVGFALIFNILKFSNFSHGGVLVASAYLGYYANSVLKTDFWLTLVITALLGGLLALAIEFVGFRHLRKQKAQIMLYFVSSVTISMLLENVIAAFFSGAFYSYPLFFKTMSFEISGLIFVVTDMLMLLISCVSLGVLMLVLYRTRLGLSIRALSMDATTTSLMGVNVSLVIAATFFVSGMLGGIGGLFLGINYTLYAKLGSLVVKGFISAVIGGLGSIGGAVIGAFILGMLEVFLINIDGIGSGLAPVVIFFIMIVFLLVKPQGIAGKIVREKA